tara:strand:- start:749 stop:1696 length:948 start_codon:yes stop_codon:yes gene_type:complete
VKILVTGCSGFVGSALCSHLMAKGMALAGTVRRQQDKTIPNIDYHIVSSLNGDTSWRNVLAGVSVVVHCAARAHIMHETVSDPLEAFREVNVAGTSRLAREAADMGVGRFIYLSSVKVNGENTSDHPFREDDTPAPEDPYGISKWEAEQELHKVAGETGLEIVIIRPPLVYGPGVRANFLRLMQLVKWGIPLPLGAIRNRRSLVALDNLVDLIATCLNHPEAVNETFLVCDGEDLSTTELLQRTAEAMGRTAYLIPISSQVLWVAARLLGKEAFARRLCGSLQVDATKTRDLLGWAPPISVDEALRRTAKHFQAG